MPLSIPIGQACACFPCPNRSLWPVSEAKSDILAPRARNKRALNRRPSGQGREEVTRREMRGEVRGGGQPVMVVLLPARRRPFNQSDRTTTAGVHKRSLLHGFCGGTAANIEPGVDCYQAAWRPPCIPVGTLTLKQRCRKKCRQTIGAQTCARSERKTHATITASTEKSARSGLMF